MAKTKEDMLENTTSKIKLTASDYVIRGIGYVFITLFAIASIFPFLIILGSSFESEEMIISRGVTLIPRQFTTAAYELVIKGGTIWASYGLTIEEQDYAREAGLKFKDNSQMVFGNILK